MSFRDLLLSVAVVGSCAALPTATLAQSPSGFDCLIEPSMSVEIGSSIRGVAEEVLVGRGDMVAKGDVLVRLESGVQVASVELSRARAASTSELASRKESLDLARKSLVRLEELYEDRNVSHQLLEESESQTVIAEANWRQAQENRLLAKLELKQAEEVLALRTIRSPITGQVVQRIISPGELITEDQPILRLAQIDPLYVEVIMQSSSFGSIQPGTVAEVTPSEPLDGNYQGEVTIVDDIIDAASGTYGIRVELPNPDAKLPAGLNCVVNFIVADS